MNREQSETLRLQHEDSDAFVRAYAWLMNDAKGRSIVQNIIDSCGCDVPDYEVSAYVEGRRSVGLEIRNWLRENMPEQYLQMENERVEKLTHRIRVLLAARKADASADQSPKIGDAV